MARFKLRTNTEAGQSITENWPASTPEARWLRELEETLGREPTVEEVNEAVAMRRQGAGLPQYPETPNKYNNPYQDPQGVPSTSQWGQNVIDTANNSSVGPGVMPTAPPAEEAPPVAPQSIESMMDSAKTGALAGLAKEDPRFANYNFEDNVNKALGEVPQKKETLTEELAIQEASGSQAVEEPATTSRPFKLRGFEPEEEEEMGFFNNAARVMGQRALGLAGSTIRGVGELGEDLNEYMGAGQFVWDDGLIPSYYSAEEFEELKKLGVTENLMTETLPMAFQDRDLGGEKRHTPEQIKEAWAAGDVGGVASATAKFIGETGIESIPDMVAAVYSIPLYVIGRSEEIAEERVRNERLSEALTQDAALSPTAQADIAAGYVGTESLDTGDIAKAAPFAALSALLERIGAKGIGNAGAEVTQQVAGEAAEAGMMAVLKEGAKAGKKEAITEFFQEGVIEYLGEKLGTSDTGLFANLSVAEGAERGAFGALAGGGSGTVAGTAIAAGRQFGVNQDTGEVDTSTTPPPGGSGAETTDGGMSAAEKVALEKQLNAALPVTETGVAAPQQGGLDLNAPTPPAAPPPAAPPPSTPTPETATTPIAETAPDATGSETSPTPTDKKALLKKTRAKIKAASKKAQAKKEAWEAAYEAEQDAIYGDSGGDVEQLTAEVDRAQVEWDEAKNEITKLENDFKAAPVEEAASGVENPMIQKKEVQEGFKKLFLKAKGGVPGIRKAVQELGTAIAAVFPDAKALPSLKGTVGAKRIGEYFATLDEEILIDETLPNLKEFLRAIVESPDAASAVQNINRLKDYVSTSGGATGARLQGSPAEQGAAGISKYDAYEAKRAAGVQEYNYNTGKKDADGKPVTEKRTRNVSKANSLPKRAEQVSELAITVEGLVKEAIAWGVEVPAEVNTLIKRAKSYREKSLVARPVIQKGGTGAVSTPQQFNAKNLNEVGGALREIAGTLVEQIDAVSVSRPKKVTNTEAKPAVKPKPTPKVEETSAVTEAPARPKKPTKAENVKESAEKLKSKGKAKPKGPNINELRQRAKALGISAAGSKAVIAERIAQAQQGSSVQAEQVAEQKLTKAEKKSAEVKAEMDKGQAELAAAMKPEQKAEPVVVKTKKEALKEKAQGGKKQAVTRKVSGGGMSDVFKDKTQIAVEEGIAKDLSSMVDQAAQVEAAGGIETTKGGSIAYALAGYITSGSMRSEDMMGMSQAQLRSVAKAVGAKPAASKKETIRRIQSAADAEVTRVETELGRMTTAEVKSEKEIAAEKALEKADPDEALVVKNRPLTTGSEKNNMLEALGFEVGTKLEVAFDALGISKQDAQTVKNILRAVDKKTKKKILAAIKAHAGPSENLRTVAIIEDAIGKRLEDNVRSNLIGFLDSKSGFNVVEESALAAEVEDAIEADKLAEEKGYESAEEMEAYEADVGFGSVIEPDYGYNEDQLIDLVNAEHKEPSQKDRDQLNSLATFLEGIIDFLTDPSSVIKGKKWNFKDIDHMSSDQFLDILIENLPSNSKYSVLAKQLRALNLDVPMKFFIDGSQFSSGSSTKGMFNWNIGEKDQGIAIVPSETMADTIITTLHEIVHAATSLRYFADTKFKKYVDQVYTQALDKLPSNFSDPFWKAEAQEAVDAAKEAGVDTAEGQDILEAFFKNAAVNAPTADMDYRINTFYGLTSPTEFLSESFTNPVFQAFLSAQKIKLTKEFMKARHPDVPFRPGSMLRALKRAVTVVVLKLSRRNTILDEIQHQAAKNFTTNKEQEAWWRNANQKEKGAAQNRANIANIGSNWREAQTEAAPAIEDKAKDLEESFDKLAEQVKGLPAQITETGEKIRNVGTKTGALGNLGFSGRDAIERENRALFDKAAAKLGIPNPLTALDSAKTAAQTLVREYEQYAFKVLTAFTKLPNKMRSIVQEQMRDITLANIDPTQPLDSESNRQIWVVPKQPKAYKKNGKWVMPKKPAPYIRQSHKDKAEAAHAKWQRFAQQNPVAAQVVKTMAALTKRIHDTKIEYALTSLAELFEFDAATTLALGNAKTVEDIDTIFPEDALQKAKDLLDSPQTDAFKTEAQAKKDAKKLISQAESREIVSKAAKSIINESSIKGWYFPVRRYGEYVLSTGSEVDNDQQVFETYETKWAAQVAMAAHNLTRDADNQLSFSVKLLSSSTVGSAQNVLNDLKSKMGEGATFDRFKTAMVELMASNSAYQSQLKRMGVAGVDIESMARAFEEYVHVSKYALGDIRMAHQISVAMRNINRVAKNDGNETGLTVDELEQVGLVQNEIAKRNQQTGYRKKETLSQVVGTVGFLRFLGAPSYWAQNMSQTYTVSLPYFAAIYGEAKGPAALFKAQGVILAALTRAFAKKSFSYESFKAELPEDAQIVVKFMEDTLLIQSTIAHEFGDLMSPTGLKKMRDTAFGRPIVQGAELAMMVMEKVPEAIEHFNRISTGLAAFKLSNGNPVAMKDAVNETQMNYNSNNRARLLRTMPGDTAGTTASFVSPIMMFKTFGVGMLKLFYGNIFDVVVREGGRNGRKEASKLAGYLMATHTIMAGVHGGIMIAPVVMAIAAVNAFREPDDEFDMEEAAGDIGEEIGGDFGRVLAKKGLPAALLGIDLSRSINLGNLVWMTNEMLDQNEYNDFLVALAQLLGPMPQYAMGATMETSRLISQDPRGGYNEFMRAIMPLKMASGFFEAQEYADLGIRAGDIEMIKPEEFAGFLRTVGGFQTTQKTEARDAYYRDMRIETKRNKRKSNLIRHAEKAMLDGNTDRLKTIFESMQEFNMSVPEATMRINTGSVSAYMIRKAAAQREYDRKYPK